MHSLLRILFSAKNHFLAKGADRMPPRLTPSLVARFSRQRIPRRASVPIAAWLSSSPSPVAIVRIRDLLAAFPPTTDRPITVRGWVRSVRRQKHVAFAEIDDGSHLKGLQAVLRPDQAKESGLVPTSPIVSTHWARWLMTRNLE
jgi:hypothetical protein